MEYINMDLKPAKKCSKCSKPSKTKSAELTKHIVTLIYLNLLAKVILILPFTLFHFRFVGVDLRQNFQKQSRLISPRVGCSFQPEVTKL